MYVRNPFEAAARGAARAVEGTLPREDRCCFGSLPGFGLVVVEPYAGAAGAGVQPSGVLADR